MFIPPQSMKETSDNIKPNHIIIKLTSNKLITIVV